MQLLLLFDIDMIFSTGVGVCVCVSYPFPSLARSPLPVQLLTLTKPIEPDKCGCSPLSELFPVSSPGRKSGMRGDSPPAHYSSKKHKGRTRAHTHTHTRFIKLRVERCFPVWQLIGCVCVCFVMSFKDTRWIQGNAHVSPQQHNKYGFSHYFCHV